MTGRVDPIKEPEGHSKARISPIEQATEARYSRILDALERKYIKLGVSETASLSIRMAAVRELTFLPGNRSSIDVEATLNKAAESVLGADLFDMLERKARIDGERTSTAKKVRRIV